MLSDSQFDLMIRLMETTDISQEIPEELISSPSDTLQVLTEEENIQQGYVVEQEESSSSSDESVESVQQHVRMNKDKGIMKDSEEDKYASDVKDEERKPRSTSPRPEHSNRKRKQPEDRYWPTQPKGVAGDSVSRGLGEFLNLDCQTNRKYRIDKWAAEISLIIQTNKDDYQDPTTILLLMEHKSYGIAKDFIKKTRWETLVGDIQEQVLNGLYTMFLGLDYSHSKAQEQEKEAADAKQQMVKMQLCDICELEAFTCAYEKALYKTDIYSFPESIAQYLIKIPEVGVTSLKRFKEEASGTTSYSLGFAKRIVMEELTKICELSKKQKKLKKFNKRCCNIVETRTEFGCKPERRYTERKPGKYKKYKKYKKKYKIFNKYKSKKKFRAGKYFTRKPPDKKKFCPKGKKNCRCWICNIEGHYANECPNRQKSEKANILQEAISIGYYPIEEPYEGQEEVFILEYHTEEESSTEEDNGTSTSENSESD